MKCSDVEKRLSLYASDELTPREKVQIQSHLQECPACREELSLHRKAEEALEGLLAVPASLLDKTLLSAAPQGSQPWLARIFGDPRMRKLAAVTTAAAALAICFFALAPKPAQANSPKETLAKMNTALALAALRGEIVLNVATTKEGEVTVTGSMDGAPLPTTFPVNVKVDREDEAATITIKVNFREPLFESVAYGKEKNTLEVVPKGSTNRKYLVGLDPKTHLPLNVANLQMVNGKWKETSHSSFKTREPSGGSPAQGHHEVRATVKLILGQKAIVRITGVHGG